MLRLAPLAMRLLVVSSWYPYPPDNGSRLRAWHLLQELGRNHALTLLTFGRPEGNEVIEPLRRFCERVTVVERRATPALGVRGLLSSTPRHFVQTYSDEMRGHVAEHAGSHEALLALQVDAARHVTGACCRLASVFDEIELGATLEHYRSAPDPWTRFRRWLNWSKYQRFVGSLSTRFTRCTVVSELERQLLTQICGEPSRITVVPNGVALGPYAPVVPRERRVIYPGSVQYSANLDAVRYFVREILPQLRKDEPDLAFWITGANEGVDISQLQGVNGVTFTGRLPDVAAAVAGSLACVVPLRQGGGTRLKVLEAMGLGTPVVSTSKGIEGLDVEPGRDLLVGDDPVSFAACVRRLMLEPTLGRTLALSARHVVEERYRWSRIGETLEAVITEAVSARCATTEAVRF